MLKLKNIKKSYKTGDFVQHALKGVSLEFNNNEFVAILGPSGSGKTTLLNIIGGLDRYDSGDLIINNKSTKKFKATEWDAYRNNCIGFIFQSYNLISHISVLENVEMALTLSGYNRKDRKQKAMEALERVGLKQPAHKKPNQLSGGQMQRVAIARALVNDPEIILADEPTGALDSTTSLQIMNLIQEISKEKLVIMVTHNPDLAKTYANRIIEFKDGEIINDSNANEQKKSDNSEIHIKKTVLSYLSALHLSFNNIKTKKGRTFLTSFAAFIGIIGIALILALSNGFQVEIDRFEKDTLAQMPITISTQAVSMDEETIQEMIESNDQEKFIDDKVVKPIESAMHTMVHENVITQEYMEYIDKIDKSQLSGISYQRATALNIVTQNDDGSYQKVSTGSGVSDMWSVYPTKTSDEADMMENTYDVLAGTIDTSSPGLILEINSTNSIDQTILENLGFKTDEDITFEDILNKEYKVVTNNDYYQNIGDYFIPSTDYESLYNGSNSDTVKIEAIIRVKEDKESFANGSGVYYTEELVNQIIDKNKESDIVKAQENTDFNVMTGATFDEENTKDTILAYLGADSVPVAVYLYPQDFDAKDEITTYLDEYNEGKNEEDQILYTDVAAIMSSLSGSIMDDITIVLIAFSSISLIVSSIMIAIITYISVLERTKEIGILRALGARGKDITRVFNAETMIIGFCSGALGLIIAYLLTFPVNMIIENMFGLAGVAKLNPIHAILLLVISVSLTVLSGFIPAKMASKKDTVIALRTE